MDHQLTSTILCDSFWLSLSSLSGCYVYIYIYICKYVCIHMIVSVKLHPHTIRQDTIHTIHSKYCTYHPQATS